MSQSKGYGKAVIILLICFGAMISVSYFSSNNVNQNKVTETSSSYVSPTFSPTTTKRESTTKQSTKTSAPSYGSEQALKKAQEYLDTMAFSSSGLRKQLEFEGFTVSESLYAVVYCGADWEEQAVRKAREYLEVSSFSKKSLKEQLEFEGFSESEAQYAVNKVYK